MQQICIKTCRETNKWLLWLPWTKLHSQRYFLEFVTREFNIIKKKHLTIRRFHFLIYWFFDWRLHVTICQHFVAYVIMRKIKSYKIYLIVWLKLSRFHLWKIEFPGIFFFSFFYLVIYFIFNNLIVFKIRDLSWNIDRKPHIEVYGKKGHRIENKKYMISNSIQ